MQIMSIVAFDITPRIAPDIIDAIAQFFACFAFFSASSFSPSFHNLFTRFAFIIAMIANGQKIAAETIAQMRLFSGQPLRPSAF